MTDKTFPLIPQFSIVKCHHCGKTYGEDFFRCREQGVPIYYKWVGQRPLDRNDIISALQGKLTIEWFCSPTCSSASTTHLLKEQNENQPIAFLNQQEAGPSQDRALHQKKSNPFRKQEKKVGSKKKRR